MTKQINEDSLAKACKEIIIQESFYGLFLMTLHKEWTDRIPTSGVGKNGINVKLYINEIFWESLKPLWQLFCLKHDILHVVFHHIELGESLSEKDIVLIASNLVVNQHINPAWIPLFDVKYKDYMALNKDLIDLLHEDLRLKRKTREEVIEELRKIPPRGIYFQDFAELNLKPMEGLVYYYNELLKYKQKNPKAGSKGYCQALSDVLRDIAEDFPIMDDHSSWRELEGMSEAEKKLMHDQIDYTMQQIAEQVKKTRGTIPAELQQYLDALDKTEPPKFDWRSYLRRFHGGSQKVYTKKLHRKYNKRFDENPGLKIKQRRRILVMVDTSDSVNDMELKEFFHEIYHMQRMGSEVDVLQCDARISSVKPYKKGDEDKFQVTGRGGTDYTPAVNWYNEHKKNYCTAIYLTDGECTVPDNPPAGKLLWVLSTSANSNDDLQPQIKLN